MRTMSEEYPLPMVMVIANACVRLTEVTKLVKSLYAVAVEILLVAPMTTLEMYSYWVDAELPTHGSTTPPVIVMAMALLVAEAGTAQVALDVTTHVTIAPLVNVLVVNVAELLPVLTPFTCHW